METYFSAQLDVLGAYVVGTSFSQHSKTHETSLPLIGVFTGKAGLSQGHLKHKTQCNTFVKRQAPESGLIKYSMHFKDSSRP